MGKKCSFCGARARGTRIMRHQTMHGLFGFSCEACHDARTKEGVVGLYLGCSSCKAPFIEGEDSHVLMVGSNVPGFYELLCDACGRARIAKDRGGE